MGAVTMQVFWLKHCTPHARKSGRDEAHEGYLVTRELAKPPRPAFVAQPPRVGCLASHQLKQSYRTTTSN